MNYLLHGLSGASPKRIQAADFPKFYVKLHRAGNLHFDLRIQNHANQKRGDLFSFALDYKYSGHSFFNNKAIQANNHSTDVARREGTILLLDSEGSVIHWDEGYYFVPGANNYNQIINKLHADYEKGNILLDLDGYKLKGRYILQRVHKNKWIIEKKPDPYDELNYNLYSDRSILSGKEIGEYDILFRLQQMQLSKLSNKSEIIAFWEQNEELCFRHKDAKLAERPYKIFPIE